MVGGWAVVGGAGLGDGELGGLGAGGLTPLCFALVTVWVPLGCLCALRLPGWAPWNTSGLDACVSFVQVPCLGKWPRVTHHGAVMTALREKSRALWALGSRVSFGSRGHRALVVCANTSSGLAREWGDVCPIDALVGLGGLVGGWAGRREDLVALSGGPLGPRCLYRMWLLA